MQRLVIIWHSRTGTAQALAAAAHAGAAASGAVAVDCIAAEAIDAATMLAADGYVFACPENLATMSGMMKEMVDRLYHPLLGQIEGRPFALIIAAGTDGEGAARQWARIAAGWRLSAIADPLIVRTGVDTPAAILAIKRPTPADLARAHDLGAAMAEGLALGIF